MSALGGTPVREKGLGSTLQPPSISLQTFYHPLLPRTLLCLGQGPRVEERPPHSESELSGFNSCSAQTPESRGLHLPGTDRSSSKKKEGS